MISKSTQKLLRAALRSLPEIPYLNKKRSSSAYPFVIGAIGVAVFGGIAALMMFSPKTRTRALGAAKDAYGKVTSELGDTEIGQRLGVQPSKAHSGNLADANGYTGV